MTRRLEKSRVRRKPVPLTPYVDMVSPSHGHCASSDVDLRQKFQVNLHCDGIATCQFGAIQPSVGKAMLATMMSGVSRWRISV